MSILEEIKSAELTAAGEKARIIESARKEAEDIISAAEIRSKEMHSDAKEQAAAIVSDYIEKAKEASALSRKESLERDSALVEKASSNLDAAVDFVIKGIEGDLV